MKTSLKNWLYSLLILTALAGTGVLLVLTGRENAVIDCNSVDVQLPGEQCFITQADVLEYLEGGYGVVIGKRIQDIDLQHVEEILNIRPSIEKSEAWVTKDGTLHITVYQRTPVLKVLNDKGKGYYADAEGIIFPLSEHYDADVPVILCPTNKGLSIRWLTDAIALVHHLSHNPKWADMIKGYGVAENDDFILFSEKERIIFGDFNDRDKKLSRLDKYFSQIQPRGDEYKIVNLKYKGQIICRKKDM